MEWVRTFLTFGALSTVIAIALPTIPGFAQSQSDICEAYRKNYAKEQEQINRMKAEPYKTNKQKHLNEKIKRLNEQCGDPNAVRKEPAPTGELAKRPPLPGHLAYANTMKEAYDGAKYYNKMAMETIAEQRNAALNGFWKSFSGCGTDVGCMASAVNVLKAKQQQIAVATQEAERAFAKDVAGIVEHFHYPNTWPLDDGSLPSQLPTQ